jgi:two-component system phosphate regulon sensor histidine kinase PhoR
MIAIHDTGKGIPPESLDRIFDRFYRVPAQERAAMGTGLGLAITKRIVNAHEGTINVVSDLGRGSTFTVILPAGAPSSGEGRVPEWLAPSSELPFERRDG